MARLSLSNLVNLTERFLERDIRKSTRDTYRKSLRMFFTWYSNSRRPIAAASTIVDFKLHSLNLGLSPRTVNNRLYAVRGFFEFLLQSGLIRSNPFKAYPPLRMCRVPNDRHARESLTKPQVKKLLDVLDTHASKRDRAIVSLILFNGLRVAEISRLNVSDIQEIDSRHTISILGKGHDTKICLPLLPQSKTPLDDYLSDGSRPKVSVLFPEFSAEVSWPTSAQRLHPDTISRICKKYLRLAGLDDPRITAHSLRHTFATLALSSGVPFEVVSKILRHSQLSTTMIYTRIDQESIIFGMKKAITLMCGNEEMVVLDA